MNESRYILSPTEQILTNPILSSNLKLCGSRLMNSLYPDIVKITPETDWDFYGPYTPEIESSLLEAGFYSIMRPSSNSIECSALYPADDLVVGMYASEAMECQVILRTDPEKYGKVFSLMTPEFYLEFIRKDPAKNKSEERHRIMRIMNQLFRYV